MDVGSSVEAGGGVEGRPQPPGVLQGSRDRGRPGETADNFASIVTVSKWPRFCPFRNMPGFKAT